MTYGNQYPNHQYYQQPVYLYTPRYVQYPYCHYFHHRSEVSPTPPPQNTQNPKQHIVNGQLNASVGSGQGVTVETGADIGGKHGVGFNAGGHLNYNGVGTHADAHLGSEQYGIHAQGNAHLGTSQGFGFNTEAQAGGQYGINAQANSHLSAGQGVGFNTEAQLGGQYGLNANAEGHLSQSQGAGFNTGLHLGGDNGVGAQAKAQFGGGQGAGLGINGHLGKYNGELGFNLGGKINESKDSAE
ncbi:hypothetical protein A8L34_16620 [Bacillus sp. FJAT-27264]|uniref:hypothetical protein n=1 Tax=Paenibacillus sp. (strain DSM 101736 / FJAT-27264) TaxID=1850362 RepID=UPI00080802F4|nr:hypothetical protein [Bacillus sp. FJAT-27264]OBZ11942.1 hypothetical protein A8L34_16620 [Bacillus sp. FJAT-27264]